MIFSPNQRRVLVALARGGTLTYKPVDIDGGGQFGWRLGSRRVNGPAVAGLAEHGYVTLAQRGEVTVAHLTDAGRIAADNFREAEEVGGDAA